MSARTSSAFMSPYVVMCCVVAMYVAKVVCKVAIGSHINSPMISGDGFHNIADILEAFAGIWFIALSRRPADEKYPFGRGNVEGIFKLAVGAGLVLMSGYVAFRSLNGLLEYLPAWKEATGRYFPLPASEPLLMGPQYFWWVTGLMAGSILLSFVMSAYETRVGRVTGHAILVADGQETLSDSMIEITILAGVFGEYYFGAHWIEYVFGVGVAVLILRTGKELFMEGKDELLQRSIGADHERTICDIVRMTPGVVDAAEIKTFKAGRTAICILKIVTRCSAQGDLDIKDAVVSRLRSYMAENGFKQFDYYIRFGRPPADRYRIAYAIAGGPQSSVVASSAGAASHIRVCDIENDTIARWKDIAVPADPGHLTALLKAKQVRQFRAFDEDASFIERLKQSGIEYADTATLLANPSGIAHICATEPAPHRPPDAVS